MAGSDEPQTLSVALVRVLLRALTPANAHALVAELAISPIVLADDTARLPREMSSRAWRLAPQLSGDENFGLHVAEQVPVGMLGALELFARTSRTVREALERIVRYYHVLDGRDALALEILGCVAHLIYRIASPHRDVAECVLAFICRFGRELMTGFAPREVRFKHLPPGRLDEHARIFGAPIRFGSKSTCLVFDLAELDRPFPGTDRQVFATIDRRQTPDEEFIGEVRSTIEQLLRSEPSAAAIAKALGLSERTLRRRLAAAGTSLLRVVDECRLELARRFLSDGQISIYEVATSVGFSHQRAFTRAFKRWTGETPLQYRQRRA